MAQPFLFLSLTTLFVAATAVSGGTSIPTFKKKHPIDAVLEGPSSPYTKPLIELAKKWSFPKDNLAFKDEIPAIKCFSTESDEFYVGMEQLMKIRAPLDAVYEVIANVNEYKNLFPGYEDVHVVSREENLWVVFWEQNIPLFFVPNVKYETYYLIDRTENRVTFRYQLKKKSKLEMSDGLIVIEKDGESTLFAEYDFFNADYGILKTVAPKRIWSDAVKLAFLSDVAVKLKAEHPEMPYPAIAKKSEQLLDTFPLDQILSRRVSFFPSPATGDQKVKAAPR